MGIEKRTARVDMGFLTGQIPARKKQVVGGQGSVVGGQGSVVRGQGSGVGDQFHARGSAKLVENLRKNPVMPPLSLGRATLDSLSMPFHTIGRRRMRAGQLREGGMVYT